MAFRFSLSIVISLPRHHAGHWSVIANNLDVDLISRIDFFAMPVALDDEHRDTFLDAMQPALRLSRHAGGYLSPTQA